MGLFDKLFSQEVKNKIDELTKKAEEVVGDALDKVLPDEKKAEEAAKETAEAVQETAEAVKEEAEKEVQAAKLDVKHNEAFSAAVNAIGSAIEDRGSVAYFKEVIEKNIPGSEVRESVSLSEIGAAEPKRNERVSAVVYKNGAPALALYIVSKNSYRREAYVLGMNACEKAGIPALRFMKEFSNEPGYIVGRVDAVMK